MWLRNKNLCIKLVIDTSLIDLFSSRQIVCSKVFQVVFVHLVYNSALFLASCCCSSMLLVVATLICNFLLSGQLVLISALPKIFSFLLWSRRAYSAAILKKKKIDLDWCQSCLSPPPPRVQISLPYKRTERVNALQTFIPENFWTKSLFKSVV